MILSKDFMKTSVFALSRAEYIMHLKHSSLWQSSTGVIERDCQQNNPSRSHQEFQIIEKFLDGQIEMKWKNGKFITVNQSVA